MDGTEEPRGLVRESDVEALIGIMAIVDGQLLGGDLDEHLTARFAARLVDAGLIDAEADGSLPSAGRAFVAMENLIQRLRFALGEYDTEPPPAPEATAHVLVFQVEEQAAGCRAELLDDAIQVLVEPDVDTPGWRLYAVYPELAPDPGFRSRERALQATARRLGGRYAGSQGPPAPT